MKYVGNMKSCREVYLGSNQVADCKRQTQHEKSNAVAGKFSPVCLLDIDLQKVGSKIRGNRHHGRVGNYSLQSVCQSPKDSSKCLIRYEWMCFSLFILPDQIWSLQSCSVPVDNGRDYMLPVKSNEPLMKLILGTRSQNIEVMDPHPSIGRQQLVPQTRFSLLNLLQDVFFQHKGICMAYLYLHTGICMTYFIMQSGICHVYATL